MNNEVQDFVAEPVEVAARLVQYDDWIVMYMKGKGQINRIPGLALLKKDSDILSCNLICCRKALSRQDAMVTKGKLFTAFKKAPGKKAPISNLLVPKYQLTNLKQSRQFKRLNS